MWQRWPCLVGRRCRYQAASPPPFGEEGVLGLCDDDRSLTPEAVLARRTCMCFFPYRASRELPRGGRRQRVVGLLHPHGREIERRQLRNKKHPVTRPASQLPACHLQDEANDIRSVCRWLRRQRGGWRLVVGDLRAGDGRLTSKGIEGCKSSCCRHGCCCWSSHPIVSPSSS